MTLGQIVEETGISADYWNVWNNLADICVCYLCPEDNDDRQYWLNTAKKNIPKNLDPESYYHFQTYSSYCIERGDKSPNTEISKKLDADSQTLIDYLKEHQADDIYDFEHIRLALMPISSSIYGHVAGKLIIE